ncbi:hypothetical protein CLF_108772 [Clonorchis sinensis]|uniref:ZSWIM1/3 RNaseH-like domain-containing protein n=1 Tax=Clonorchis sinensis TaxID=79923 RepID=G7YIH7_CLOSI|nr:hypothetical protein CLF_108772 [Clonorchis sinensis]
MKGTLKGLHNCSVQIVSDENLVDLENAEGIVFEEEKKARVFLDGLTIAILSFAMHSAPTNRISAATSPDWDMEKKNDGHFTLLCGEQLEKKIRHPSGLFQEERPADYAAHKIGVDSEEGEKNEEYGSKKEGEVSEKSEIQESENYPKKKESVNEDEENECGGDYEDGKYDYEEGYRANPFNQYVKENYVAFVRSTSNRSTKPLCVTNGCTSSTAGDLQDQRKVKESEEASKLSVFANKETVREAPAVQYGSVYGGKVTIRQSPPIFLNTTVSCQSICTIVLRLIDGQPKTSWTTTGPSEIRNAIVYKLYIILVTDGMGIGRPVMYAFAESKQFAPMRKLFGLFKGMMGKQYPVRTFFMDKLAVHMRWQESCLAAM